MRSYLALALAVVLFAPACATNAKPEVQVAGYTATVVAAATELQKGITAATDAKSLPVPVAQKLTGYVEVLYTKSGQLADALTAYHAGTSVDLRRVKASEVVGLIASINGTLSQLLGTSLPDGVMKQIGALIGNVIQAVGAVQAQVAKGL